MDDPDQKTTYAAEDMVTAWLDATSPETGEVWVTLKRGQPALPTRFTPETEPRFTRPADVAEFVDRVLSRLRRLAAEFGSNYRGREQKPVRVISFAGFKHARYHDGIIALPQRERGGAWALRGMVVLHELAHHLNTGVDGAIIDLHGEGFRHTFVRLVEDVGWSEIAAMLREAYLQVGLDHESAEDDGMLAKVGKLLRHAEGASTESERDAFFSKAQQLATTHSIELAVARAAHQKGAAEQVPGFETVRLGHRGQQSNVRFIELMLAVTRANDLRCTVRTDNTAITAYGFRGDIEVAKALYVSLVVQMVADGDAYIRSGAHRPVHGRTARAAFYEGWTDRIGQRLAEAQRAAQLATGELAVVNATSGEVTDSKSLALVAKDVELDDYFGSILRQRGVRGTWRGSSGVDDDHSQARGRAAAERARLGREKELSA